MLSEQVPYYILDLLQQAPAVQVVGLGRFEAIFHPAVIESATGRIQPPSLQASFLPGEIAEHALLSSYISYVSGYDSKTADEAIQTFVATVIKETQDQQSFTIDAFGVFSKADNAGIRFTPDWDAFNLSFRGLEAIPLVETFHHTQESHPPQMHVTPVTSYIEETPTEETPSEETLTEETPPVSVSENILAVHNIQPQGQQSSVDDQTTRLWWIILISAITLIAILCSYLIWDIINSRKKLDELKYILPENTSITPVQPAEENDTVRISDNLPAEEEPPAIVTPVTPDNTQNTPDTESCYIVVGAFGEQKNVTSMQERVVALGYTVEIITGGSLSRVAIKTHCDRNHVQQVLHEVRNTINPEAWIY